MKKVVIVFFLGLLCVGCVVRRPLFSPHRSDTPEHRKAKTVEECLACHGADLPKNHERVDCLKCHRILLGG